MKCVICFPESGTLEAATALSSAISSFAGGSPSSIVDISRRVATGSADLSGFDAAVVVILCVRRDFCDDVWRWYGLERLASAAINRRQESLFLWPVPIKCRPRDSRIPFFENSEDGFRGLITFITTGFEIAFDPNTRQHQRCDRGYIIEPWWTN
jgi:hypothetical protein